MLAAISCICVPKYEHFVKIKKISFPCPSLVSSNQRNFLSFEWHFFGLEQEEVWEKNRVAPFINDTHFKNYTKIPKVNIAFSKTHT